MEQKIYCLLIPSDIKEDFFSKQLNELFKSGWSFKQVIDSNILSNGLVITILLEAPAD